MSPGRRRDRAIDGAGASTAGPLIPSRPVASRRVTSDVVGAASNETTLPAGPEGLDMDPRVREHAEIIVDHSIDLQPGEEVVVWLPAEAEDLAVALHELCGDVGATPTFLTWSDRAERAFLTARRDAADDSDPEFATSEAQKRLFEAADATVIVRSGANATEQADVDPATTAAYRRASRPVQKARLETKWCLTQHPTPAHAQLAGMSTEAYENFVYDAVGLDWAEQREHQDRMVQLLDGADQVRIRSGDRTDVRMSIAGNTTLNDHGKHNLPAGEVFTAPVKHSVEGEVYFDMPIYRYGREIRGAHLQFEDGEVVAYSAERNEETLAGILDTDEGSRYLGELGIGMNRQIDRFSYNILFDEKLGDTVHMAVGMAYDECVGPDNEVNESAEHVDMICDMSEDSVIEVDGEVVQRNGRFVFEDGFE
jgi:aminopeptidase